MDNTVITITTINIPTFLEGICENIKTHDHKDTSILIIGDLKTPAGIKEYCANTAGKFGVDIEYLGIEDQKKALSDHQKLLDLFPYNTPDRVILGGMLAYLRGCERTIAVDDDNFTTEHDFVGFHSVTGTQAELDLIHNETGWFNVHSALVEEHNIPFYPRGYPWEQRKPEANQKINRKQKARVIVNQGLVLEDPDIDAISRLFWPIRATAMSSEFDAQFGLYPGTWSPFNYQNTSLCREAVPLYYRPISTKRNADIWTAYLYNKLAQHFGDVITFGQPLVRQIRNEHNLWEDLDVELINNRSTDYLIYILRNVSLSEKTYFSALGELINKSQKELTEIDSIPPQEHEMIKDFFGEYQVWWNIVSDIIK
ncbi:MAG: hypothetical protein Q8Q07_06855 [Dehalococcoidales bacterium]|nr:hypothetical protein [Dehalococcoidales bacterium]